MRSEASTSLRGLAGAWPFFPFGGIVCVYYLHRNMRAAAELIGAGGAGSSFESTKVA
jgi:hypothetical protein